MPVRAAVTLAATAIGVILLFSFRTPPSVASISAVAPPALSSSASPTSTTTPSGAPPSGGASPTPTATPTPAASGLKSGTFTGQTYTNPYGDVQVQVVISAGKITNVTTLHSPDSHQQSVSINSQALPLLREEVLKAQSAKIDIISGATFTSEGYAESVQSALDLARA
jgi:uncharacterized protein with FMN-binding domain